MPKHTIADKVDLVWSEEKVATIAIRITGEREAVAGMDPHVAAALDRLRKAAHDLYADETDTPELPLGTEDIEDDAGREPASAEPPAEQSTVRVRCEVCGARTRNLTKHTADAH